MGKMPMLLSQALLPRQKLCRDGQSPERARGPRSQEWPIPSAELHSAIPGFRLGRPDVLPVDDYGVRNGYRLAYGLPDLPRPRDLAAAAKAG